MRARGPAALLSVIVAACRPSPSAAPVVARPSTHVPVEASAAIAEPLVLLTQGGAMPLSLGTIRFVLFDDGRVVWQRELDHEPAWFLARLSPEHTRTLHRDIEGSTRAVAELVSCASVSGFSRTALYVKTADGALRSHVIEDPERCRGPGTSITAPEIPPGLATAMASLEQLEPPGPRSSLHPRAILDVPGEASLTAALDRLASRVGQTREQRCRNDARRLRTCVEQVTRPDRAEELCAELAGIAATSSSCLSHESFDDVCTSSYTRGCPRLPSAF